MTALPNWGSLTKAVDDATTIDDAITAAVAAHLADSAAHLDTGASLESHKAETVIDHPAGSVLVDKLSSTENWFNVAFQTLDGISSVGSPTCTLGLGIQFDFYGLSSPQALSAHNFTIPTFNNFDATKNFTIQFPMWVDQDAPGIWRVGVDRSYPSHTGIYFDYDETDLKAIINISGAEYTSGAISYDAGNPHLYRIQYDATTRLVSWFIDGVVVASTTLDESVTGFIANEIWFAVGIDSAIEPLFNFGGIYYGSEI